MLQPPGSYGGFPAATHYWSEWQFTPVSSSAYTRMLEEQGVPADYIWLINYLFTEVLGDERNSVVTNDIENVLGRKAKGFSEYARETPLWCGM